MIVALVAIYEFLVALAPLLYAIGTAIAGIVTALWEIAKITAILTLLVGIVDILFDPKGAQRVGNLLANFINGALKVAQPLLTAGEGEIGAIVAAFTSSIKTTGPTIAAQVTPSIQDFVRTNINAIAATLGTIGESTAANAAGTAAEAMGNAFGLGISSHVITAAFEALLPEKLNTLNGVGPILSELAGFKEVAGNVLEPLYKNAFGRSLEYQYRAQFKPELPDEADAVLWHSRRLLTDAQLRTLFGFSGLKAEYEEAFVQSAYRAVQPRMFASLFQDNPFPTAQAQAAMEFAGLRPADVTFLLQALEWNSFKNVRQEYLSACVRSTELGTMTPAELDSVLTTLQYSDQAKAFVQLTVATRKLEQLAELYRKSVSEAYRYGTITDAQYVPSLEAIGIAQADAEAHYAVDSIAQHGKQLLAAERAASRLAASRMRAEGKAAIESYRQRQTDAATLEATLLAAGYDPMVATFTATLESLKRDEQKVFVYGVELPKGQAELLREEVSAIAKQTTAQLVTPEAAYTALVNLGIPGANATALVAAWSATKTTAADVGVFLKP